MRRVSLGGLRRAPRIYSAARKTTADLFRVTESLGSLRNRGSTTARLADIISFKAQVGLLSHCAAFPELNCRTFALHSVRSKATVPSRILEGLRRSPRRLSFSLSPQSCTSWKNCSVLREPECFLGDLDHSAHFHRHFELWACFQKALERPKCTCIFLALKERRAHQKKSVWVILLKT